MHESYEKLITALNAKEPAEQESALITALAVVIVTKTHTPLGRVMDRLCEAVDVLEANAPPAEAKRLKAWALAQGFKLPEPGEAVPSFLDEEDTSNEDRGEDDIKASLA